MKAWKKRFLVAVIVMVLLGVGTILFVIGMQRGKNVALPEKAPLPVTARALKAQDFLIEIEYTGKLEAASEVTAVSKVRGTIEEVHFEEGTRVKKGEIICRLEDDAYYFARQQAEAVLELARENYRKIKNISRPEEIRRLEALMTETQSALKKAENDAQRFRELYREGAVSLREKEAADANLDAHKARASVAEENLKQAMAGAREEDIAAAGAEVSRAQAAYDLAQDTWEDTVIRAPISGVVSRKFASIGDTLEMGMPVCEIVDISSFKIDLGVSGIDVHHLKRGDTASVELLAGGMEYTAVIKDVGVKADEDTGTFPVILKMENPGERSAGLSLRAGMDVRVRFVRDRIEGALVIPTAALIRETGARAVFVIEDNVAVRRVIVLGPGDERHATVKAGLKEGELVVVVGQHRLRTGDKVEMAVER